MVQRGIAKRSRPARSCIESAVGLRGIVKMTGLLQNGEMHARTTVCREFEVLGKYWRRA